MFFHQVGMYITLKIFWPNTHESRVVHKSKQGPQVDNKIVFANWQGRGWLLIIIEHLPMPIGLKHFVFSITRALFTFKSKIIHPLHTLKAGDHIWWTSYRFVEIKGMLFCKTPSRIWILVFGFIFVWLRMRYNGYPP